MTARYNAQRQAFATPFWSEGWALYWEMLLWDRGFADTIVRLQPRGAAARRGVHESGAQPRRIKGWSGSGPLIRRMQ